MTQATPIVVWFRRDLRLHDHPALIDAVASGRPVAPLFVVDPSLVHGRFESANRTWFLLRSVEALRKDVEARGGRLTVRVGDPSEVVPAFAAEVGAADVIVSRDYTPYGRRRDRSVAEALSSAGVEFHAKRGLLVHEPEDLRATSSAAFGVFSPFLRRWQPLPMRDVLAPPDVIVTVDGDDGRVPELPDLGFDGPTADEAALPEAGEAAARRRLDAWIEAGGPTEYHETRDRLADPQATSHLSPYLRFGLLSPVEVATRALATDDGGEGSRRFVSELAWRDFYAHALWAEPRLAREPMDARYADMSWEDDPAGLAAWEEGATGYPIIDAAMRQLHATGWIPNRARMITASFLTKDLLIDWRAGERHFMQHLVDGDPASNLGGWQWAASVGTDSRPFVRIFNPVTQAKRFDPDGRFVRRWLPELADVPAGRIHEPWTMSPDEQASSRCRIGVDYPPPIVDHAEARRRALARYAAAVATSDGNDSAGD
jgi:deoxyribodipyrimidine photo-lyase